jgi:hypothetical protein
MNESKSNNLQTGEWNDSLKGEYLCPNVNTSEAIWFGSHAHNVFVLPLLVYVGKVNSLGNGNIFLSLVEIVGVLNSEKFAVGHISTKREMGIPAVVGCGNAVMNLKTGDRIRGDGGKGTVELVQSGICKGSKTIRINGPLNP